MRTLLYGSAILKLVVCPIMRLEEACVTLYMHLRSSFGGLRCSNAWEHICRSACSLYKKLSYFAMCFEQVLMLQTGCNASPF